MKDFHDLQRLAASSSFDVATLSRAIRATFERRGTPLPADVPLALQPEFLAAPERETQWRAFLRRGRLAGPPGAAALTEDLRRFLLPVLRAAGRRAPHDATWRSGGPWVSEEE